MRQNLLDQAKLTAEGEMEFLFFRWKNKILTLTSEAAVASELVTDEFTVGYSDIATRTTNPVIADSPWEVSRALRINGPTQNGTTIVSGSTRTAQISSFTALTRSKLVHPILGTINYELGRRFALTKTSLFQFSVFYQDTMEFSTGSAMTIRGDITTNGDIHIGSLNEDRRITVTDKIFFARSFNGVAAAADAIDETKAIYFRANSIIANQLYNPIFSSNSDQSIARENQIKKLADAENFVGGTNVTAAMSTYGPTGTGAYASSNDIYRSVIAPRPKNALGVNIAEDPVVNANRMSEKAGIIIEVRATTDPYYADYPVKVYTKSDPSVDYAITHSDLIRNIIPDVRKQVFDTRENTYVNTTVVDIGNLKTALTSVDTPEALKTAYNGIVYAYDPNAQSQPSGSTAAVLNGIRLENASTLPFKAVSGKPVGFTIASDNAIYIKGNYNTVSDPGNPVNTSDRAGNPASIMADAISLLSSNWDDSKATGNVQTERIATSTTVYAALLSGNTPTNAANGTKSGGVQNLIRLMENWNGQNVKVVGSLGQLFVSKYFTGAIRDTGPTTDETPGRNLYMIPGGRELTFDTNLANAPPNGAPTTTRFARGDYFTWQLSENPSTL